MTSSEVRDGDRFSKDRVAVAMATYNGAQHLGTQLHSIQSQSRPPDQLVVCDDGSQDGTLELVEAFARRATFEVVLHRNRHRLGYARNFQQAVSLAEGSVVFLSDQDDVWEPVKIETVLGEFERHADVAVVVHDLSFVGDGGRSLVNHRGFIQQGGSPSFVKGCATAVRKEFAEAAWPIPEGVRLGHDDWLHALAIRTRTRRVIENRLVQYRVHDANTSGALPKFEAPRPIEIYRTLDRVWRMSQGRLREKELTQRALAGRLTEMAHSCSIVDPQTATTSASRALVLADDISEWSRRLDQSRLSAFLWWGRRRLLSPASIARGDL